MSKIRYGTSSKKGLIRSKAFPKINKINIKNLIAATVPSGGGLTPGFLWIGPSITSSTMFYYPFGFEDTDEYWTYNIQHNGLPSTSPFWINRNNLVGKRVKINNPHPVTALESAISGVEFEIIGKQEVSFWNNQLNIYFKVPKSFMPIKLDWQWGDPQGKTLSIYSETDLGYLGGTNGILAPPAFTLSRSSNNATVGLAAVGFTINSTGGAIDSYTMQQSYAGQLFDVRPPNMYFNTTTGELSGQPGSAQDSIDYIITATNSAGVATQTFNWTSTYQEYQIGDITPDNMMIVYDAGGRSAQNNPWGRYLAIAPENWFHETVVNGSKDPLMHLTYFGSTGWSEANSTQIAESSNNTYRWVAHDPWNNGVGQGAAYNATVGHDGWFIPSQDAIQWWNEGNHDDRPWLTSDYQFKATDENIYLTSSEYANNPYNQFVSNNMTNNTIVIDNKDNSSPLRRVRPMKFVL
jgi:hypothetical protein